MNPLEALLAPDQERWAGKLVRLRRGARVAVYDCGRKRLSYRELSQSLSFVCAGVSAPSDGLESSQPSLRWEDSGQIHWARVEDVCEAPLGPRARPSALAERLRAA